MHRKLRKEGRVVKMEKDREEEGEGEEKSYTTGLPWILI